MCTHRCRDVVVGQVVEIGRVTEGRVGYGVAVSRHAEGGDHPVLGFYPTLRHQLQQTDGSCRLLTSCSSSTGSSSTCAVITKMNSKILNNEFKNAYAQKNDNYPAVGIHDTRFTYITQHLQWLQGRKIRFRHPPQSSPHC